MKHQKSKNLKSLNKILKGKIEKSLDIIYLLYRYNLITDAYVIGNIAEGNANQYSEIEIGIINSLFELQDINISDLKPISFTDHIKMVIEKLKEIGVKFRIIKRKELEFWCQIHRNELFHIMISKDEKFVIRPRIHFTKDQMIIEN